MTLQAMDVGGEAQFKLAYDVIGEKATRTWRFLAQLGGSCAESGIARIWKTELRREVLCNFFGDDV